MSRAASTPGRPKRGPTQAARVLRMLRQAGSRGVTAIDFLGPQTIDGRAPILNLSGRIAELRVHHEIVVVGRRDRCVRYVLRESTAAAVVSSTAPPEPALFARAIGAPPPRCAVEPWEDE